MSTFLLKRRMSVGGPPAGGDLQVGEIALDFVNRRIYGKNAGGVVIEFTAEPAGSVQAFAGTAIPSGWLDCNGDAVSRTTYADLFAAIGTTWGVGDGATTFNVPDLRGRVVVAAGTGSGLTARNIGDVLGEEEHTLDVAEMPAHTHDIVTHANFSSVVGTFVAGAESATTLSTPTTEGAGGGDPHNNMQPSLVMRYIIRT